MDLSFRAILSAVGPELSGLKQRIAGMLIRGIVTRVDDSLQTQMLQTQLMYQQLRDEVAHLQEYGFSSVPLDGAEIIVAAIGGSPSHLVALRCADPRHRPTGMAAGDVAMYDHRGSTITLTASGVTITSDSPVTIDATVAVGTTPTDHPVLASALADALDAAAVSPGDGGAAFKTALAAALRIGTANSTSITTT